MNRLIHRLGWLALSLFFSSLAYADSTGLEKVFVRGSIASGGTAEILLGTTSISSGAGGLIDGHTSLFPNKKYQLTFNASAMGSSATLTLVAPLGHQFYINGIQRSRLIISNSGGLATVTEVHDVEMRSNDSGGTAGTAHGVGVDDISWGVNVGRLYSGALAGSIVISEAALNTALFDRGVLNYSGINQQVTVLNDSQGRLRQVIAPEVFVDARDVANGFALDFYPLSAMGALQNGLRQITNPGEKYVSYTLTPGATAGTLNVVRTAGSVSQTTQVQQSGGTWLTTLEGQLVKEDRTTTVLGNGDRVETVVLKNAANEVARKVKRTYRAFAWNLEADYPEPDQLIQVVTDPDGAALTTSYDYYTNAAESGSYKQLKSVVHPDGNWVKYEYYDASDNRRGQVKRRYAPWKDSPATPADATLSNCKVVDYDYVADWDGVGRLLSSQITKVLGTTVAQESAIYTVNNTVNGLKLWTQETRTYTDATQYVTVSAKRFQPGQDEANSIFNSLPYSETAPDGTKTSYLYQRGDYNGTTQVFTPNATGLALREISFQGTSKTTIGTQFSSYDGVGIDVINLVPYRSTQAVKIRKNGRLLREEVRVYAGAANFPLVAWTTFTYTASGRLQRREANTGAVYQATWVNEFRTSEITETGEQILYSPDALQRIQTITKSGVPARTQGTVTYPLQGNLTTVFTYNAAGDVTTTVTTGGGKTLTASATFDKSGRKLSHSDDTGALTGYAYTSGGQVTTATMASGSTAISTTFRDGQLKSITGTGKVPEYYDYSYGTDGTRTVRVNSGTASSGAWSSSKYDRAGRLMERKMPTTLTNVEAVQTYFYDAVGKLIKTTAPGQNAAIQLYDELGAPEYSGLDVDGNGSLTVASLDRLTKQENKFVEEGGAWWWQQRSYIYPKENDGTAVLASTTKARLSGFSAGVFSEQKTIDAFGNETVSYTEVDPLNRLTYAVVNAPNAVNDAEVVSYNGHLVESLNALGERITYTYDGVGRPSTTVHPRKGTLVTSYHATRNLVTQTHYENGPILAKYSYDAASRVIRTENAAGHFSAHAYDAMGRPWRTWGSAAYPCEYNYDALGRLETQVTYRSGAGWTQEARPDGDFNTAGLRDVTTFAYYGDTPALKTRKDAANKLITYVYDAAGRLQTQTQARLNGADALTISAAFASATGELTGVTYSDNTPAESYTYTRLGQNKTITDVTGTRTFAYDTATGLQLADEILPSYFGTDRRLHYTYETTQPGALGRAKGVSFGTSAAPGGIQAVNYLFTSNGQVESIAAGPAGGSRTFSYGYEVSQPQLVKSVSESQLGYTVARDYDPQFDMVKTITTQLAATVVSKHEYVINTLGQRQSAKQSGTAFADYGEATFYRYAYNSRGELTTAAQFLGTNVDVQTQPLPGRRFEYGYDAIGNRTAANHTGTAALAEDYTANALNQVTTKENHLVHFSGTGVSGLAVRAHSPYISQSGSQGRFWSTEVGLNNVSTPAKASIRLDFGKAGAGAGGTDIVGTDTRAIFLPPALETFEYDHDGNLTRDGQWTYGYDAKNQLTRLETRSEVIGLLQGVAGGEQPRRLEFSYDYQGRRVGKKTYSRNGASWVLLSERRFVYQGWNVIAELDGDANKTVLRQFFWGLDITSTLAGGGGVGGLLMIQDGAQSYFPGYDGNGNVTALVRGSDSTVVASYEYSPFGELLRTQGSYAAANPFRFSTKWQDDDTGLLYYGKRYYNPRLGRFINRDPAGEAGGMNLYAFTQNNPGNSWDFLGNNPMSPAEVDYYLRYAQIVYGGIYGGNIQYMGESSVGAYSLYQDSDTGDFLYEDPMDGAGSSSFSFLSNDFDPRAYMQQQTAFVGELLAFAADVAETSAEMRRQEAAEKAAFIEKGLAWMTDGTIAKYVDKMTVPTGTVTIGDPIIGDLGPSLYNSDVSASSNDLQRHYSGGYSYGFTAAIPALGILGAGVHGEANIGFVAPKDKWDTRLQITGSGALMGTIGAAIFGGGGLYGGWADVKGPPEKGFQPSDYMLHLEGGVGGLPLPTGGPVVNGSIDFDMSGDYSASGSFPGGRVTGKGGWGWAAYAGVGLSKSITWTSPSIKEMTTMIIENPPLAY